MCPMCGCEEVTELGTLSLSLAERSGGPRWKLEFDVRLKQDG